MQFSFCFDYNSKSVQIGVDFEETEALTTMTWTELFKQAQNYSLPYYWISVAIPEDNNNYLANGYDGTTLAKCQELHTHRFNKPFLDPLTRLPIIKICNLFFKCFDFTQGALPMQPLENLDLSSFQFSDLPPKLVPVSTFALNVYSAQHLHLKEQIGKAQFIIGQTLLSFDDANDKMEGVRWIWSAAQKGIKEACTALGGEAFLGKSILPNIQESKFYYLKAIELEDPKAIEFYQRCFGRDPLP